MDIQERFRKAIVEFEDKHRYLTGQITRLGFPVIENSISTAGVTWDDTKKRIKFLFNEKFAEKLTDEEFYFVVSHEAIHILNCHVFLFKDEIETLKKDNKTDAHIQRHIKRLNIASDCVVNDSLVNIYKMNRFESVAGDQKLCWGKELVGSECHDMTSKEVFLLLDDEKMEKFGQMPQHTWDSFFDENGNLKEDFVKSLKDVVEEGLENSNVPDEDREKLFEMKKTFGESNDPNVAGNQPKGNLRQIDKSNDNIRWNIVLSDFVETRKTFDNWSRQNRKLYEFYPDTLLPKQDNTEVQEIFVAVDSSGSIDRRALTLFVNLLRNCPSHIKIKAISFDTKCYEFDIYKDKQPQGGGGTNFQIIENYIQINFKKYPKCVIVLTDGEATFVKPKYPDKWLFLLYGSCCETYIGKMKRHKIKDLMI
jgi:predicted metal-dependent peptidase